MHPYTVVHGDATWSTAYNNMVTVVSLLPFGVKYFSVFRCFARCVTYYVHPRVSFFLFFPTLGQGGGAWLRTCVFFVFSLAWRKCYTWAHAWPLLLPIIFVYYSPGDKAQKVIPGGSKTNESFWKSQNSVKKWILRFPPFVFTTALVIERKKLSPEARKQTRASESPKITSTNQFYASHHACLL